MLVIPSINETNFEEIKKKLQILAEWGVKRAHIDVSDGVFSRAPLWNNPTDLRNLQLTTNNLRLNVGVHLMVKNPDEVIENWLDTGVKTLYVHYEVAADVLAMKEKCEAAGVKLGLAVGPSVPVEGLFEFKNRLRHFLILAVEPGPSGQKTLPGQIEKVKALRQEAPEVDILFDGGVSPKNLLDIKSAGASAIVSGSYIWKNESPEEAYKNLTELA